MTITWTGRIPVSPWLEPDGLDVMDGNNIEVRAGRGWRALGKGSDAPPVTESGTLHLRGLAPAEVFFLGPFPFVADTAGCFSMRLLEDKKLQGHLGLVELRRQSGILTGEFAVVPDKMSEEAFRTLRSTLEELWARLIFDPGAVSRLQAQLPSPAELWRVIEAPVREIAAAPRTILVRGEGMRRLEAVRRPSELTASVIRAAPSIAREAGGYDSGPPGATPRASLVAARPRPGRSGVVVRSVDTPESALVAETLRRLIFYARRQPGGAEVAARASRMLRKQPFASCSSLRGGIEAARLRTLHDSRYRRVDKVLRVLDRPEAYATEGPGEARLGVEAIERLYEYWVLLQVLDACRERYGAPLEPGFRVLGRRSRSGTTRLGIPAGATVSFPGDVHAAFEPRILASGRGWQGLENVPHPDRDLAQDSITPDVVVLRRGTEPALVVFDAKYVGRHWVDYAAAKIHVRYSRVRLHGTPVVRNVLAAHPHQGKDALWAGYGMVPMVPGQPAELSRLLP